MTKNEIKEKIKSLETELNELKCELESMQVGYKDDKIFLLSIDEYKRYKDIIPNFCWWWLRSPGHNYDYATYISFGGAVYYGGICVNSGCGSVRPAIKIHKQFEVGTKIFHAGYTWIVLDTEIAICETAIVMRRFDEKSNDYETSEIRKFLLEWYKERKEINNSNYICL